MSDSKRAFYAQFWQQDTWAGSKPNPDEQARLDEIVRMVERHVPRHAPLRVLDVGCGRGWLSEALKTGLPDGSEVIGIDPVPEAIELARNLFPSASFSVCNQSLEFEGDAGSFDLVVCSEVIEHVPDNEKIAFLRNVASHLRQGGGSILPTPRGELWSNWSATHTERQPVEEWLTRQQLTRMVFAAQLSIVEYRRLWVGWCEVHWVARLVRRLRLRNIIKRIPPLENFHRDTNAIYQIAFCRRSSGNPDP